MNVICWGPTESDPVELTNVEAVESRVNSKRVGMIDVVSQDYIRTARAKGLGEGKVILKHALRNSLLPIITVFAAIFPMAIGGSIIIEVIFSIPGMGVEAYNGILNYDYPMIITVFTLAGFLTMVGYLVADILYAVVDPRISYK
mgnify:CR=1 FL=1